MQPGQEAQIDIEAIPRQPLRGHVDSIQAGSGARFSLLPPENAVGNFVKVVQRVPVKILFDEPLNSSRVVGPGMSVLPKVRVKDDPFPRWALALAVGLLAGGSAFGLRRRARRHPRHPSPPAGGVTQILNLRTRAVGKGREVSDLTPAGKCNT